MNIVISIDSNIVDGKRAVTFDGQVSHHITEIELQQLLEDTERLYWENSDIHGALLGKKLFALLNGSGGRLANVLRETFESGETLTICLQFPKAINDLPFEIINDGQFIALRPNVHIIRRVTDRNKRKTAQPDKRKLNIVFMACSPSDLADKSVLNFEDEEEKLYKATEKFQVEIFVEDSGSVEGLSEKLYEVHQCDVLHITGHAVVHPTTGPIFHMENEIGEGVDVTPEELWEKIKDFPPKLLLLSGCETGKSDATLATVSFAHEMVEYGIPFVLGWGLSVSDTHATSMTTILYQHLAKGKSVFDAVHEARKSYQKDYYPWPLLRFFSDGSPLTPLVEPDHVVSYHTPRTTKHKQLKDSMVTVLEKGFVGRRKNVQQGIKVLKGKTDKYGLIVRGPAGVGKSSLAGKLIERSTDKELLVFRGQLERAKIYQSLKEMFDKYGIESGIKTLKADAPFEEKIKYLFRTSFKEKSTLIYFDDFEQNLERRGDDYFIKEDVKELVRAFLEALDWCEWNSTLMITSRYPFIMEVDGKNLPALKLEDISLMSMKGSDLEKKTNNLINISKSEHKALYIEFGRGNPRLLEWLEIIAEKESEYNLEDLKKALQGQNEEYYQKYLADIMARCQSEDFQTFLHKAATYRIPVEQSAFLPFGTKALLDKGVDLTLIEREQAEAQEPLYWVAPVIRESEWNKLYPQEKQTMHELAYKWYDDKIEQSKKTEIALHYEAIYHTLESNKINDACKHGAVLGSYLSDALLYQDRLEIQSQIAVRITLEVIGQAIEDNVHHISDFINELGIICCELGDLNKAKECFLKVLEIDYKIYGEYHRNIARCYCNLGETWRQLGNSGIAIEYFNKALEIDIKVFGENDPIIANDYNNLGLVQNDLGFYDKAIIFYRLALLIHQSGNYENNDNIPTCYNNIGTAYSNSGDQTNAIKYANLALEININMNGEDNPKTAISYNNLGAAYSQLGDQPLAIKNYEKALEKFIKVYSNIHSNIAACYNNIGEAWGKLDNPNEQIVYCTKALEIDKKVYGENHPSIAIEYNNLGSAWRKLHKPEIAIDYFTKALEIMLNFYGKDHPSTITVLENLEIAKEASKNNQ